MSQMTSGKPGGVISLFLLNLYGTTVHYPGTVLVYVWYRKTHTAIMILCILSKITVPLYIITVCMMYFIKIKKYKEFDD